jgi:hypothetical protein
VTSLLPCWSGGGSAAAAATSADNAAWHLKRLQAWYGSSERMYRMVQLNGLLRNLHFQNFLKGSMMSCVTLSGVGLMLHHVGYVNKVAVMLGINVHSARQVISLASMPLLPVVLPHETTLLSDCRACVCCNFGTLHTTWLVLVAAASVWLCSKVWVICSDMQCRRWFG